MLNRFLNQGLDNKEDNSKKIGITKEDSKVVIELLESYTKHQLQGVQYRNRNDSLLVQIQSTSPSEKMALQANTSLFAKEPVAFHALPSEEWEQSELEEPTMVVTEAKVSGTPVRAHMSGSVYLKPNPTDDNFVSEGKTVKEGDILCLLEAMKLFSEVKAPLGGVVKKIFVEHGSIVKEGDILFEIAE